jgi:hypothetical protein
MLPHPRHFLIFILFNPKKQTPENAGQAFSGAFFSGFGL